MNYTAFPSQHPHTVTVEGTAPPSSITTTENTEVCKPALFKFNIIYKKGATILIMLIITLAYIKECLYEM